MDSSVARPAADRAPTEVDGGSVLRAALVRFALLSIAAGLVLMVGTIVVAQQIAEHRALETARGQGAGMAHRLAAPLVDRDVRSGDLAATERLSTVMANRMRDGSVHHIKMWDESGRVIWSDDPELVGQRFELADEVAALFGTRDSIAELSNLSAEENAAARADERRLEVYVGAHDREGVPLVLEAHLATDQMESDARHIVWTFVPLVVGALVLFMLVVLPLAVSLCRRIERARAEQARMTRHALLASDLERRRIADDLHDGVVQDLAGLGYALPTAARMLEEDGRDIPTAQATLARATDLVHRDVTSLRSMMADLYPPDLRGDGLRPAVGQLVHTEAVAAGLEGEVDVDEDLEVSVDAGRLAYRVVREGLRNVVKHASARHVRVELRTRAGEALVRVVDDGRGPGTDPELRVGSGRHLGLTLLRDTIHDVGGSLELQAPAAGGTVLEARFPTTPVRV